MLYDSLLLHLCVEEINATCRGSWVESTVADRHSLWLTLGGRRRAAILVSCQPKRARVCAVSPKLAPRPKKGLRNVRELAGVQFVGAEQVEFERLAVLSFVSEDGARLELRVHLFGSDSGVFLTDAEGRVVWALRQGREGTTYAVPVLASRLNPLVASSEEVAAWLARTEGGTPVLQALRESIQGISTPVAEAICETVGVAASAALSSLPPGTITLLANHCLAEIADAVKRGKEAEGAESILRARASLPEAEVDTALAASELLGERIELLCRREAEQDAFQNEQGQLMRMLGAQRARLLRQLENRGRELEEAEAAYQDRIGAEMILAHPGQVPTGAAEVELPNLYAEDATIRISLDPALSAAANAQRLFERHRKKQAAAKALPALIEEARERLAATGVAEEDLYLAETCDDLAAWRSAHKGVLPPAAIPKPRRLPRPKGVRVLEDVLGYRLLVGTSAEGNDSVLRQAAPDDIWLHARGGGGTHAVIHTLGHPEKVPQEVLLAAAQVAARLSSQRHSSVVAVDYTLRKFVRKAKGKKPGLAYYERAKTLFVNPGDGERWLRQSREP